MSSITCPTPTGYLRDHAPDWTGQSTKRTSVLKFPTKAPTPRVTEPEPDPLWRDSGLHPYGGQS